MFRLLIVPALFAISDKVLDILETTPYSSKEFEGLKHALIFIIISLFMASALDWKILWKMFCGGVLSTGPNPWKKNLFVTLNWVTSYAFLFTVPSVMSSNFFRMSMADTNPVTLGDMRTPLLVAFGTVSYLVMGFAFLLQKTLTNKNRNSLVPSLKQCVPPLYYAVTTMYVWRSIPQVATTVSSIVVAVSLFSWFRASRRSFKVSSTEHKKDDDIQGSSCEYESSSADASLYRRMDVPVGSEEAAWNRQLMYDLGVYVTPLALLGFLVPSLRLYINIAAVFMTFARKVYEHVVMFFFLHDSPVEDPMVAKKRLATYQKGAAYPTGWFRVLNSDELDVSQVKYTQALGRDLAVFRGEDGKVRALDAYCVHLGANMGVGGRVVGNCLQCPFHLWEFGGDGSCAKIPYSSGSIPASAKTKAYHVMEYFGQIIVWFKLGDENGEKPDYYPPVPKGMDSGDMVVRGSVKLTVNMHLQEFAENSTDFAHFGPLHGTMGFPFTPVEMPEKIITINHIPGWVEGKGDESHMCWFLDGADLNILGKHRPGTYADAKISFVGPAGIVFFSFETPIGNLHLFQSHTPRGPLRLETNFRWFADAKMPRLLVWYIVGNWIGQWQNDFQVWENKKFCAAPILVKGDGPMNKSRRWFKQFLPSPEALKNTVIPGMLEGFSGNAQTKKAEDGGKPGADTAAAMQIAAMEATTSW